MSYILSLLTFYLLFNYLQDLFYRNLAIKELFLNKMITRRYDVQSVCETQ